jgi:hypothetical protein
MLYIRGDVFMRVSLVRVLAEVAGYLTDDLGILEFKDEERGKFNILFHTDNVKIYKKDVKSYNKPLKRILPVGCMVSTEARSVHISKNIKYQASVVLAALTLLYSQEARGPRHLSMRYLGVTSLSTT